MKKLPRQEVIERQIEASERAQSLDEKSLESVTGGRMFLPMYGVPLLDRVVRPIIDWTEP